MAAFALWICLILNLSCCEIRAEHPEESFAPPPLETPEGSMKKVLAGWVEQSVDHFNPVDNRTWQMRYYENQQFFKPGGPIFVYVGGFWPIRQVYLQFGQIYALAKRHNGYMFCPEHRFYGQSYPVDDLTMRSLQYLSTEQVLADLAYFIEHQKATTPGLENSKVVLIGCSYAGTLATWARIKYPHVFDVAYASSAPLRAVEEFPGYFEAIGQNILRSSKRCYEVIKEAVATTETLLNAEDGQKKVNELYNTCRQVDNREPRRSWFFKTIAEIFATANQRAGGINDECDKVLSYKGQPIDKLSSYLRSKFTGRCVDIGLDVSTKAAASTKSTLLIHRQLYYQYCTEYGHFRTSASQEQPFGNTFSIDMYHNLCKDLFGSEYNVEVLQRGIKRTNLYYGGSNPSVTNLISVHGTADPWHKLGLSQNISEKAQAFVVDGAHMCEDLSTLKSSDHPQMSAAKLRAQELIAEWLGK